MIQHSRPWLTHLEEAAVTKVQRSGMLLGDGPRDRFRENLNRNAYLFPSGRVALKVALLGLGLPVGAGVVVQTYVCDAVIWAIRAANLKPMLCDVGSHWVATPESVARVLTPDCAAIILAPPFGFAQSANPFHKFGLPIVRDLCQSSPIATVEDKDIVTLSFHPTKYICASGGGAVVTGNDFSQEFFRQKELYYEDIAPFSNMQAAIGNEQLMRMAQIEERRAGLFDLYKETIPPWRLDPLLQALDVLPGSLARFVVDTGSREASRFFIDFEARGVTARHGVGQLAHRLMGLPDEGFPNAVKRLHSTLSLPFYPALNETQAQQVADAARILLA